MVLCAVRHGGTLRLGYTVVCIYDNTFVPKIQYMVEECAKNRACSYAALCMWAYLTFGLMPSGACSREATRRLDRAINRYGSIR